MVSSIWLCWSLTGCLPLGAGGDSAAVPTALSGEGHPGHFPQWRHRPGFLAQEAGAPALLPHGCRPQPQSYCFHVRVHHPSESLQGFGGKLQAVGDAVFCLWSTEKLSGRSPQPPIELGWKQIIGMGHSETMHSACCRHAFSIPPHRMVEWQSYFYLDDALLGNTASLEEVCRTLPGVACLVVSTTDQHVPQQIAPLQAQARTLEPVSPKSHTQAVSPSAPIVTTISRPDPPQLISRSLQGDAALVYLLVVVPVAAMILAVPADGRVPPQPRRRRRRASRWCRRWRHGAALTWRWTSCARAQPAAALTRWTRPRWRCQSGCSATLSQKPSWRLRSPPHCHSLGCFPVHGAQSGIHQYKTPWQT